MRCKRTLDHSADRPPRAFIVAGGPPIIIGGNDANRKLPKAACYADKWNAVLVSAKRFSELNAHLDELLRAAGRSPEPVRRMLMTHVVFGRMVAEVERKLGGEPRELLRHVRGVIVGPSNEIVEQLGPLEEAGVQRVMV